MCDIDDSLRSILSHSLDHSCCENATNRIQMTSLLRTWTQGVQIGPTQAFVLGPTFWRMKSLQRVDISKKLSIAIVQMSTTIWWIPMICIQRVANCDEHSHSFIFHDFGTLNYLLHKTITLVRRLTLVDSSSENHHGICKPTITLLSPEGPYQIFIEIVAYGGQSMVYSLLWQFTWPLPCWPTTQPRMVPWQLHTHKYLRNAGQTCKLWSIGPNNASISFVDYNGLISIISFMSVNSSVRHTRGSYTSYFTSHIYNIWRVKYEV